MYISERNTMIKVTGSSLGFKITANCSLFNPLPYEICPSTFWQELNLSISCLYFSLPSIVRIETIHINWRKRRECVLCLNIQPLNNWEFTILGRKILLIIQLFLSTWSLQEEKSWPVPGDKDLKGKNLIV